MEEEKKGKKTHKIRNTFIIFIIIISAFILYARFISTKGLKIKEYPVYNQNLPTNFDGYKIIHFSDLHFGSTVEEKDLKKIVNQINKYKPNIVVFTGDLLDDSINITEKDKNILIKYLKEIKPEYKKYAITGNNDYNDDFKEIMENSEFTILNNSYDLIFYKEEQPILIAGLPSSIKDTHDYQKTFSILKKTESDEDYIPITYKILLLHEPDNIDNLSEYNLNLVLSGHSHGGQIKIPFYGAIAGPIGAKKYYNDYYKVGETDLFISSGIGTSQIPFRFCNKPSINLYRLYKSE